MSYWGHFAGIIRIARDPMIASRQKGILKKIFTANGDLYFPKKAEGIINFPKGSEGPIKSKIITSEWEYTVVLYGDIRGVENKELEYAKKWWADLEIVFKKNKLTVLQSILNINMDYNQKTTVLTHENVLFKNHEEV